MAIPELVASCCTLLVLAPLALMPGLGTFLFRPMAFAVAFAMIAAYLLSRTLVPALGNLWLHAHRPQAHPHLGKDYEHRSEHENPQRKGPLGRAFAAWESLINRGIQGYIYLLNAAMRRRLLVVGAAVVLAGRGGVGTWLAPTPRVLPGSGRRRLRDVRAGAIRHAH